MDEYFINIMHAVGARATCDRGRTGCVLVKDKHIISLTEILQGKNPEMTELLKEILISGDYAL
jgi:deoxycytidylate deaminase